MSAPLAILCYERLIPGNRLGERLEGLGYGVIRLHNCDELVGKARAERPMVAVIDLASKTRNTVAALRTLRGTGDTAHIPILAFASGREGPLQQAARDAGADLVACEEALLEQLPSLLEQILDRKE